MAGFEAQPLVESMRAVAALMGSELHQAATALSAAPRELIHPGVLKYLREAGIEGARR